MAIIIGSDEAGKRLKESYLLDNKYDVVDVTGQEVDFVDATLAVAKDVQSQEGNRYCYRCICAVALWCYKIKGMIAAEVSDERSGYMTRGHNNSRMITMGSEIVGAH